MKKILVLAFLLSACAHDGQVPGVIPAQVPDLPKELSQKAEKLPELTDPSLGAIVLDSAETSRKYNAVSHQMNAIIDLYHCVQKTLNEKTDPKTCLKD